MVAVLYSISLVLPKHYFVERSIVIDASSRDIFPHVHNLREWPNWTAWWTKRYPEMSLKFGEKDSGVGAEYSWAIPNQRGGSLKVTGSNLGYGVGYTLDFDNGQPASAGCLQFKPT